MNRVELLSPAKNLVCGKEAILHGADAVYIGSPKFGARQAAGNSLEDLQELVQFAHAFHARIYVTFNTLLRDDELAEAEKLIWQLYEIGVDALIIQDTGIFEMNLPPIALHASTQADNRTVEKVAFWQAVGCEQVVLARELSLEQIKTIAENTQIRLEAFVHGALCVSYSGQCYASYALTGRSANRGECSQICRLPFDLQDSTGHSLGKKHWLSLKDMNRSENIGELLDAGVRSFKIEGRLKEVEYVKNVTAYYRKKIDEALATRPHLCRLSEGDAEYQFTPNPQKTFHRGSTTYFLHGREKDICSLNTPKSIGEYLGQVTRKTPGFLEIDSTQPIHNGDGLCFIDAQGELSGFRVNTAENNRVVPNIMPLVSKGTKIYRNVDESFLKILGKPTAVRKLPIRIQLEGQNLILEDVPATSPSAHPAKKGSNQQTIKIVYPIEGQFEAPQRPQEENYKRILGKLGDTLFKAIEITVNTPYFFPASVLTQARREACEQLLALRIKSQPQALCFPVQNNVPFPLTSDSYRNNIANHLAEQFYARHGATITAKAYEVSAPTKTVPLMYCQYCIRYQLGACPKLKTGITLNEPLFLIHKNWILRLKFDCAHCQMLVEPE